MPMPLQPSGHSEREQSKPAQPSSHRHVLLASQEPWPLHPLLQVEVAQSTPSPLPLQPAVLSPLPVHERSSQPRPWKPGAQKQLPLTHTPCRLQSPSHTRSMQSTPVHPFSHSHRWPPR